MIVMNLTRKPILPSGAQDAHRVGILSPLSQAQLSIYLSYQGLGETDGSTTSFSPFSATRIKLFSHFSNMQGGLGILELHSPIK